MKRQRIITEVLTRMDKPEMTQKAQLAFNEVLSDISRYPQSRFMDLKKIKTWTLSSGDYQKDLPSDFMFEADEEDHVTITWNSGLNGQKLTKVSMADLRNWIPNFETDPHKTRPCQYAIDTKKINFIKSNGTYTLNFPYYHLHDEVNSNTDTILLSDTFKPAIMFGLRSKLYRDLDDAVNETKYENLFIRELDLIKARETELKETSDIMDPHN